MEFCVGVSTETVLQVVKFYTIVKTNFKTLTFYKDCNPSSEFVESPEGREKNKFYNCYKSAKEI